MMKFVEVTFLLLVVLLAAPVVRGLWVNLPGSGTKCVSEELHNSVVVLADYHSFFGEADESNHTITPSISVKVTSPYGTELHHQQNVSYGNFAFTTTESGNYMACFSADGDHHKGKTVTVGIDWKIGIDAKDWDSVARKEKISGLELELVKLQGIVHAIYENLDHLVSREFEMRDVSEKTNARVVYYSLMSLGVCIVVSLFQIWYLRRYFQKKKLI